MKKILITSSIILVILVLGGLYTYQKVLAPTSSDLPNLSIAKPEEIKVLSTNLSIPWDIAHLPDGDFLITERTGTLALIGKEGGVVGRAAVPKVVAVGEGGLLGIALHLDFSNNNYLYIYRTVSAGSDYKNQVVRFQYQPTDHTLADEKIILDNIPAGSVHNGGALSFGPDGYLYITTGDTGNTALAPNLNSLSGKILRITAEGEVPSDNPFGNEIYSYGHRNPQGLAWDEKGQLWSVEHGRSGLQSGLDELNKIIASGNYGWPNSEGDKVLSDTIGPIEHSGTDETWAPSGLAYYQNTLYFTGLRGQKLYQAKMDQENNSVDLQTFFSGEYGRLRAARIFGDTLYITTSNNDRRGQPDSDDDKLIAVPLELLVEN